MGGGNRSELWYSPKMPTSIASLPNAKKRADIRPGIHVRIILKQDQLSGLLTDGIVKDILTNSTTHPHGIKVRLQNGQIGRVQEIIIP